MLHVDSPGIKTGEIAHQLFEGRWMGERIDLKDFQKFFRLRLETGPCDLPSILDGLPGQDDAPTYHLRSLSFVPLERGSLAARCMLLIKPGT